MYMGYLLFLFVCVDWPGYGMIPGMSSLAVYSTSFRQFKIIWYIVLRKLKADTHHSHVICTQSEFGLASTTKWPPQSSMISVFSWSTDLSWSIAVWNCEPLTSQVGLSGHSDLYVDLTFIQENLEAASFSFSGSSVWNVFPTSLRSFHGSIRWTSPFVTVFPYLPFSIFLLAFFFANSANVFVSRAACLLKRIVLAAKQGNVLYKCILIYI